MATTYYAGPGKLVWNGAVLWPLQENGKIVYAISQEKNDFAQAMHGRVGSTLGDTVGRVSVTPYDNWTAIQVMFPQFLGVTTAAGAGLMAIGTRPHNAPYGAGADVPGTIWSPDGHGIVINRMALIRHPDLHLGVDKPLYGAAEFITLPKTTAGVVAAIGSAAAFHTITETALGEPVGQMITSDFVREAWTGAIATGPTGFTAGLQAEEEWTITSEVKYDQVKVQKQTLFTKLSSVQFMAKARLVGPTWTNIEAAVLTNRVLGSRWANPGNLGAAVNLILTSASGKTIQLNNVDVYGEGFEFGGATLDTGEVGFVTQLAFTAGAPNPQMVISA